MKSTKCSCHGTKFDIRTSRGLGWTSLAIGLTEILAPRQLEQTMGIRRSQQNTGILRVLGVREMMHGFDLLTHRNPAPGIRARFAGDLLDGVLLGAAAARTRRPGGFMAIAAMVLPVVALDLLLKKRLR
jgi:hypothetical protein